MKKLLGLMILSLVVIMGISGCQTANEAEIIEVPDYPSDVIDWSMYSWQEDGEWVFSIVDRYAGYTSFEEISAEEFRLDGLEVLVEALLHLPDNSEILWTEYAIAGTVLPPSELLYEILTYCNSIGVPVIVMN